MVIVLARYGGEVETFLGTNPGLRSRFPTIIKFPYIAPKYYLHLLKLLAKLNISMSKSITEHGGQDKTTILSILEVLIGIEGWTSGRNIKNLSRIIAEPMPTSERI
jgi:hypothetical protein